MLDNETKRKINTARDILVGKVPDPKSQVEQITIALIYKFMDDMDMDAEELGGEPSFFSGEYERYGWRKIFDPHLGGFEMLSLYSEAILKMSQNPNLPLLFREIFKNAYLPYHDPETLKSFLKIINDFSYDHSEKLGDAFEYLLSVLGSQGDAGQFRTPRHIIDFMTALIAPRKNETILDPACGTAGFLISAYKYILKENSTNYDAAKDPHAFERHNVKLEELTVNGKQYQGDKITPDERARIINNIKGYDISPDMVRLSLVNLYLHGFTDPHIFEYDTLTSEDRWNEFYDVILANPPFMSPKGGIRPHKRFTIQSKRSEVLFVDYMAEHLTPTGRAAIIVPEGVIFQSGTAYKSLRKLLVEENYLVGIISLPSGLFNPYSGVKTSILWLDKTLAKKTDQILFAKIEADGFDLGAQRRPVKQNDLPAAFRALQQYIQLLIDPAGFRNNNSNSLHANDSGSLHDNVGTLRDGVGTLHATSLRGERAMIEQENPESILQSIFPNVLLVAKKDIAEKGEYNLSGEQYKNVQNLFSAEFDIVSIGDVFTTSSGGTPLKTHDKYYQNGTIPWLRSGEVAQGYISSAEIYITNEALKNSSAKIFPINTVLVAMYGATAGQVGILKLEAATNQAICGIIPNNKAIPEYLYLILKSQKQYLISLSGGGAQPNISQKIIRDLKIPLPPLSVQQEIVAEIEGYQKIIDGAKMVVENYKPKIEIDPEWEMVELGELAKLIGGGTPSKQVDEYWENGTIDWVSCSDFTSNSMYLTDSIRKITEEGLKNSSSKLINEGTLILVTRVSLGKLAFTSKPTAINQDLTAINFTSQRINKFYTYYYLLSISNQIEYDGNGVTVKGISREYVRKINIPLPSIETQRQIVTQIEKEQELVNANKQLIEIFEQKIKDRIAKVWGEPTTTKYRLPENNEPGMVAEP